MRLGDGGTGICAFPRNRIHESKHELRSKTSRSALAYSLSSSIGQLKLFFSISLLKLFLLAAHQTPTKYANKHSPKGFVQPTQRGHVGGPPLARPDDGDGLVEA